jgi:hypothetical protein
MATCHLLQSATRVMHSPALPFWQFASAASWAVSRSLRRAAPACLPSRVVANAPHIFGPICNRTLQPEALHSLSATASARSGVAWLQLTPYLPVPRSHASAPWKASCGNGAGIGEAV